jgi:hypothetical protein
MPLLVTGSIGIDTVRTPHGSSEDCIGGSAIYFTMAASFFAHVRLIGVVGSDCPFDLPQMFHGRDVDLGGLEVRRASKTFRWAGTYQETMDDRVTDYMELNVLAEHPPVVPKKFADSKFVFLANTAPRLQIQLLSQVEAPLFVAADTMNCWITDHLTDLTELLTKVHCLIINEEEAKLLARQFDQGRRADPGAGPGHRHHQEGRIRLVDVPEGREQVPPAGLSGRRREGPDRCGRQLRRRVHGLSRAGPPDGLRDAQDRGGLWHGRRLVHHRRFLSGRADGDDTARDR